MAYHFIPWANQPQLRHRAFLRSAALHVALYQLQTQLDFWERWNVEAEKDLLLHHDETGIFCQVSESGSIWYFQVA